MKQHRLVSALALAALVTACGGGGGSGPPPPPPPPIGGPAPPPPPPPAATCSVLDRQNWVGEKMNEWYLFPETLPASLTPTQSTVDEYVDHLTATARAQGRDRYFTYVVPLAQDIAFYASGSNAGFGMRISTDVAARRAFLAEAYEGGPALAAGIDRGTEILAIGTSAATLKTVDSIILAEGSDGVINALGPAEAGLTRVLRVSDAGGTRDVTIVKKEYDLTPVSSRYGAKIIEEGGKKVGYLHFRTFIASADPALRAAFAQFKAAGITEYVIDLRYNGGGLVSIARLIGDLMGANRSTSEVFLRSVFRPGKGTTTFLFAPQPQSVAPTRVAFIGTKSTASSSEIVINGFIPYLGANMALIGTNTFGKPVGQSWIDRPACDDRLKVVAFAFENAVGHSAYYSGLAGAVPNSCQAGDDLARPLGDPQEASIRQALDFLAGKACTKISTSLSTLSLKAKPPEVLVPARPNTAQQEAPGTF
jgi:C-terminal processing protease CtpA/Prc